MSNQYSQVNQQEDDDDDLFINQEQKKKMNSYELDEYNQPASIIELDHHFNNYDTYENDYNDDDDTGLIDIDRQNEDDTLILSSSGRASSSLKHRSHIYQRRLRACYGVMIILGILLIGLMLYMTAKILNMRDNGSVVRAAYTPSWQAAFKIQWSPTTCITSLGLVTNCPLAENNYKVNYAPGFLITEYRRAENGKKISQCKPNSERVQFNLNDLSNDLRNELNLYWPSLTSVLPSSDLWRDSFERNGNCMPTQCITTTTEKSGNSTTVTECSYSQEEYFRSALRLREQVQQMIIPKLKQVFNMTSLEEEEEGAPNKAVVDNKNTITKKVATMSDIEKKVLRIIPSTNDNSGNVITAFMQCDEKNDSIPHFQAIVVCVNEKGILENCSPEFTKFLMEFQRRCGLTGETEIYFPLLKTK